ncbi:hypothetical protein ACQ4PT_057627 [Festuca glaucescens]
MGYPFQQRTFSELVKGMDACDLDAMHKEKLEALMVYDPKRKVRVPSRFCSFHLAGFDLDDKSTAPLGQRYQPSPQLPGMGLTDYVTADAHYKLANYSTEVVSVRVVRAGPDYTYPVQVYGKVIARDQIDHKCVYLFDRDRKDAQTIYSEKDMLALTGPYRALVTLAFMYFEFDLKIKGKGDPDDEVQFSKGVIPYYCKADRKRIISQLPSFQSTVKLVLQNVDLPVAANSEVSVVKQGPSGPLVHFDGKITAGTMRNYRQHTVLYDSSVPSSKGFLRENGSLVLNRNMIAVNGYVQDPALEEDEKLVLYVCFLDADCEITDEDETDPEQEDEDEDETDPEDEDEDEVEELKEEEDFKNVIALKYPRRETIWEYGCPKLKVKVDWTAILDTPKGTDFFHRYGCLPRGCSIDYRWGTIFD